MSTKRRLHLQLVAFFLFFPLMFVRAAEQHKGDTIWCVAARDNNLASLLEREGFVLVRGGNTLTALFLAPQNAPVLLLGDGSRQVGHLSEEELAIIDRKQLRVYADFTALPGQEATLHEVGWERVVVTEKTGKLNPMDLLSVNKARFFEVPPVPLSWWHVWQASTMQSSA